MAVPEFITSTRYSFQATSITEKPIQKIDSANVETPPAEQIQGVVKGKLVRQGIPTAPKMGTIKLTLGITRDKEIYDWYAECNPNNNEANTSQTTGKRLATIIAYDQDQHPVALWHFDECYPISYTVPDFVAGGSDIALETVEIQFTGMRRES